MKFFYKQLLDVYKEIETELAAQGRSYRVDCAKEAVRILSSQLSGCVCFLESSFREITFQTFLCLFVIRKVGQRKTLSSQRKIWLCFQESVFLENLGGKHFPEVVKNLEMSLFADYFKFDPQTFDCYI